MKKTMIVLILMVAISFCRCSKEEEAPKCSEPVGKLRAQVHDTFVYDARFTEFYNLDDNTIQVNAYEFSPDCIWIGSLSFALEKKLGRQELKKPNRGGLDEFGESIFVEVDQDVILGDFPIYEAEPRWLEITDLGKEKLEGVFSATYVFEGGPNRFINLPDTLRFNNVAFEAIYSPPNFED